MKGSNRIAMAQGGFALLAFGLMLGIAARAVQPLPERPFSMVLQEDPPRVVQAQAEKPADSQVFIGTVEKNGSAVVFRDQYGTIYQLDDPAKAKPFVGKSVKLTGELQKAKQMIVVKEITPVH
jgi:hypothetical protein